MDSEPIIGLLSADDEAELTAVQRGLADIAAGRVVPHVEVVRWLETLGTANPLPPR